MENNPGFIRALGICRRCLTISGLWCDTHFTESKKFATSLVYAFNFFTIVMFINVAQTTKLIMIWGDVDEMSQIISTCDFSIAILIFKMLVFRNCRSDIAVLIEFAEKDWNNKRTTKETETMEQNSKTANRIYVVCLILGNMTVHIYTVFRIAQELGLLPAFERRMPLLDSYFPYDDKSTPAYEITWLWQYASIFLGNLAFSGIYCLFIGLVLHLCGQFANLRDQLVDVVPCSEEKGELKIEKEKYHKRLGSIVNRHENLNRCAQSIEDIYNRMFFAEILSSTIQMCSQWFMLVTIIANTKGGLPYLQIFFLIVYTSHNLFHLFACCFVAEKLQNESLSIFNAAYSCEWYNLTAQDAKLLLVVMQRAKTPVQLTAGKLCIFGLELYAKIVKTAGGYLTMLLAVRERLMAEEV